MAPSAYGILDFKRFLNGTTAEDLEMRKAEAMATTVDDLRGFSDLIRKIMAQDHIVAIGDGERLKATKLFDVYRSLKQ